MKTIPKKIKLNGEVIGSDDAWIYDWLEMEYVSPKSLGAQLDDASGEDVEVYMNSPGGSVWAGSEMYTMLKEYPGKVTAKITGVAASAMSFMAMAADEIQISLTGQVMIHNASSVAWGDKNDFESGYNMLKSTDEAITNAYMLKTGKPREELLDLMNKTTWLNAQEAKNQGFVDLIMFDDGKVFATNSAASSGLSPDIIQRLKNKLLDEKGREIKNIADAASAVIDNEEQEEEQEQINKEGDKPMDFKELQEKHPGLVNEIMTQAINAERSRISALHKIANAPGAAPFIEDAIANGESVGDVATKIVLATAERVQREGQDRQKDASNSRAAELTTQQPANQSDKDAADEEASIQNMVKFAAELINKGGRI